MAFRRNGFLPLNVTFMEEDPMEKRADSEQSSEHLKKWPNNVSKNCMTLGPREHSREVKRIRCSYYWRSQRPDWAITDLTSH